MRTLIVPIVVAALLLALAAAPPAREPETYVLWGDPQKGRAVYAKGGCAACHAIRGVGGTAGPDLGRPPLHHRTVTQMAGVMWNHAPAMRRLAESRGIAPAPLSEAQMLDLLTYLYSLHFLDEPGNARRGERLFATKGCASCHQLAGDRPGIGPPLSRFRSYASPILWAEVMWTHAVTMEGKMRGLGLEWPTFKDNEMVDLITYIRSAVQPGRDEERPAR